MQTDSGRADASDTWLGKLGPGLITGAADDDPSGIATYAQAGASSASACCGRCA